MSERWPIGGAPDGSNEYWMFRASRRIEHFVRSLTGRLVVGVIGLLGGLWMVLAAVLDAVNVELLIVGMVAVIAGVANTFAVIRQLRRRGR